ncbi:MAG: hypothetical protein A3F67_11760 [Verrucomicrobia bacterium RIFCSPHIGHO2_12_FULL_41_10]|nr:MAG: hypothetical protein A3F67_11760 [Verrucomicrobia bacterium RIFCSPHIGHO2_12_FULL_41_10]
MPSSKNYIRNYAQEGKYESSELQKKRRAARNKARALAMKNGSVSKGDGKDVDHKKPLSKGGSTGQANTRVVSRSSNRSFPRTKKAGMK